MRAKLICIFSLRRQESPSGLNLWNRGGELALDFLFVIIYSFLIFLDTSSPSDAVTCYHHSFNVTLISNLTCCPFLGQYDTMENPAASHIPGKFQQKDVRCAPFGVRMHSQSYCHDLRTHHEAYREPTMALVWHHQPIPDCPNSCGIFVFTAFHSPIRFLASRLISSILSSLLPLNSVLVYMSSLSSASSTSHTTCLPLPLVVRMMCRLFPSTSYS